MPFRSTAWTFRPHCTGQYSQAYGSPASVPLTVETEPKTARGRERKGAIIEVAAALMYERGVRATGLQDVLAESRSGKSRFYH